MNRKLLVAVIVAPALVMFLASFRQAVVYETTQAGALAALAHIEEWAKWMTGIQSAALAVLAFVLFEKDTVSIRKIPKMTEVFAALGFSLLASGLFISAWIFSSISSHAIRIYAIKADPLVAAPAFDIYETAAFGWTPWLKLGYILSAAQWFWGVGLVCMAIAIGSLLFRSR